MSRCCSSDCIAQTHTGFLGTYHGVGNQLLYVLEGCFNSDHRQKRSRRLISLLNQRVSTRAVINILQACKPGSRSGGRGRSLCWTGLTKRHQTKIQSDYCFEISDDTPQLIMNRRFLDTSQSGSSVHASN